MAQNVRLPTACDEDRRVALAFKVNATPTYVFLDVRGNIVLVHRGGGSLYAYVLPCRLRTISLADGQEIPLMEEGVGKLGC